MKRATKASKPRRISRSLTHRQRNDLLRNQRLIAGELQDLAVRDQMRKEARDESTLSGELRRAIHASPLSLVEIAAKVHISQVAIDDFLTGERTLRSDVLDRLATHLGFQLSSHG